MKIEKKLIVRSKNTLKIIKWQLHKKGLTIQSFRQNILIKNFFEKYITVSMEKRQYYVCRLHRFSNIKSFISLFIDIEYLLNN